MQPCQICGTADIDVNGYCVNCRTFRGAVHYEVVTPSPGYASPPTSVPPVAPVKRRRNAPLSLLIFTTAALLVVSTILIVTVIMNDVGANARASADRSPGPKPSGSAAAPSASVAAPATPAVLASGIDKCVVGTWATTMDYWPAPDDSSVMLATHNGEAWGFRADGSVTIDFGSGVTFSGTVNKKKAQLLITGHVKYKYTATNRTLNMTDPVPDVRAVYTENGVVQNNTQVPFQPYSASYSCNGDNLTFGPDDPNPATARRQ